MDFVLVIKYVREMINIEHEYEMKEQYDFSDGERGKFYNPDAIFHVKKSHNKQMDTIFEHEGRNVFGHNAAGYDNARPDYPEEVFAILMVSGALYTGATTLEVGAGNGLATKRLIELGANPITVIEPDSRFSKQLHALPRPHNCNLRVIHEAFEDVRFEDDVFDLVVIATAFHWLDPITRVEKLHQIVRTGGHVALFWNVFQDLNKADPFHEATQHILAHLSASPSGKPNALPFALDRQAREMEFLSQGFELVIYLDLHWTLTLDIQQVRQLYESFSQIARLPDDERTQVLDKLVHIAETEFNGTVQRNMTTPLYLFRKI